MAYFTPYTDLVKDFFVPLDVGLVIVFSLTFAFFQMIVSMGITWLQFNPTEKYRPHIHGLFLELFMVIKKKCDILIKAVSFVWKYCLFSLFLILFLYFIDWYSSTQPAYPRMIGYLELFIFLVIIVLNIIIIVKTILIPFKIAYMDIKKAVDGLIFKSLPKFSKPMRFHHLNKVALSLVSNRERYLKKIKTAYH